MLPTKVLTPKTRIMWPQNSKLNWCYIFPRLTIIPRKTLLVGYFVKLFEMPWMREGDIVNHYCLTFRGERSYSLEFYS